MASLKSSPGAFPDSKKTPGAISLLSLFALPTAEELQACWELCRLQNGMGCWIVWLPTAWSIAMSYKATPELTALQCIRRAVEYVLLCGGIKSLIMTIDDILDHDVDAQVERTKNRALPRGAITLERAWLFFAMQVAIGVWAAKRFLSPTAFLIAAAVFPLNIIYPTCKRWTYLAPVPLGVLFNVGVFMGWADLHPHDALPLHILVPVFLSAFFWTLTYETVYQHQDKVDDVKVGLKSMALLFGSYTVPICTFCALSFFGLLTYGGVLVGCGAPFLCSVGLAAVLLLRGLWRTDVDVPKTCLRFFLETPMIGQIILGGLVLDGALGRHAAGIPF